MDPSHNRPAPTPAASGSPAPTPAASGSPAPTPAASGSPARNTETISVTRTTRTISVTRTTTLAHSSSDLTTQLSKNLRSSSSAVRRRKNESDIDTLNSVRKKRVRRVVK